MIEPDEETLLADGFEEALIGYTSIPPIRAVYDRAKCIAVLMKRDGMTDEDADEFFGFNVEQSYVGEYTPIFVELNEES